MRVMKDGELDGHPPCIAHDLRSAANRPIGERWSSSSRHAASSGEG